MATKDRVAAHRERMRKAGYRRMQRWVRDTSTPEYIKEAHEQSLLLAAYDRADPSIQQWVDAMQADIWNEE